MPIGKVYDMPVREGRQDDEEANGRFRNVKRFVYRFI